MKTKLAGVLASLGLLLAVPVFAHHSFAAEYDSTKMVTVTGVVGVDRTPPHNFSRDAIEQAIDGAGFQLWRLSKKTDGEEQSGDRLRAG